MRISPPSVDGPFEVLSSLFSFLSLLCISYDRHIYWVAIVKICRVLIGCFNLRVGNWYLLAGANPFPITAGRSRSN